MQIRAADRLQRLGRGIERLGDWIDRRRRGNQLSSNPLSRPPRRSLREVLEHAKTVGVAPRTVIDVGVASGTPPLYAAFPTAALLLVEPVAEWRPKLQTMERRAPLYVETVAAGRQTGETTLYVHRVPGCSSMLGARAVDATEAQPRVVPVEPLDDLVFRHGLQAPFVLKIDVEGAELEVLAGAPRSLETTDMVLLEVSFFPLVPGAPQVADVICAMRDLGWSPYDVYGGHLRPIDGALAQIDMAFVRTESRYRARHEYATREQAELIYRSWGY